MSLVSVLFVGIMLVSCALMAYKRAIKGIVIVFTLLSYGMFVFAKDLYFDKVFVWYLLSLVIFTLFLYKKYGSQCFGSIFFILPWVITARAMGFPDSPNFGEKSIGVLMMSGLCVIFSLWLLFLKHHQKIYQKALFVFFNACLISPLCFFSKIEFQNKIFEWIMGLFVSIDFIIALSSSPVGYVFFFFGEFILLFLVCYPNFFKNPNNPIRSPNG